MSEQHGAPIAGTDPGTGRGVLLATDLGMRCDRATARAIHLAGLLGGLAMAATVVEGGPGDRDVPRHEKPSWYRPPEPGRQAGQRLRRDLADSKVDWDVRVGHGNAGDQISALLDGAPEETVVVTGPVRQGVLGPVVLGSTVDRLLRRDQAILLMVRTRAHGGYRHLLAASDFSAPSRAALRRARGLFPDARLTLLHGFTVPMLGLMDSGREQAIAQARMQAQAQGEAFLRECGADHGRVEVVAEHGDPARLVQQYAETFAPDLVVVGTHGHGAARQLLVGSVARRILDTCLTDTLVVRG